MIDARMTAALLGLVVRFARQRPPERVGCWVLGILLMGAGWGGPLVRNVHWAALALEQGATRLGFDRDLAQFAGLRFTHLQ